MACGFCKRFNARNVVFIIIAACGFYVLYSYQFAQIRKEREQELQRLQYQCFKGDYQACATLTHKDKAKHP